MGAEACARHVTMESQNTTANPSNLTPSNLKINFINDYLEIQVAEMYIFFAAFAVSVLIFGVLGRILKVYIHMNILFCLSTLNRQLLQLIFNLFRKEFVSQRVWYL